MNQNLHVLNIKKTEELKEFQLPKENIGKKVSLQFLPEDEKRSFDAFRFINEYHNSIAFFEMFYDENKKVLKSLESVGDYLLKEAKKNPELLPLIYEAKDNLHMFLEFSPDKLTRKEFLMKCFGEDIDENGSLNLELLNSRQRTPGVHALSVMNSIARKDDNTRNALLKYVWPKEQFVHFMACSEHLVDVRDMDEMTAKNTYLLHFFGYGASFAVSALERQQHKDRVELLTKKSEAALRKNERKLEKLSEELKKQKELSVSLQNKLGKKSNDSKTVKELSCSMDQMKSAYEKELNALRAAFNQERKEFLREIEKLEEKNHALEEQLSRYTDPKESIQEPAPLKENLDLAKYNVLFMGGHPNLVNKLSDKYPGWTFHNDSTLNSNLPKHADFIVYFTDSCSHTVFRQVQSWNKTRKRPALYVHATNLEQIDHAIQNFIHETDELPKHFLKEQRPLHEILRSIQKRQQSSQKHADNLKTERIFHYDR